MRRTEQRDDPTCFSRATTGEGEPLFTAHFGRYLNDPRDETGASLLAGFKPPRVLALVTRISHPGLRDLMSEGFESLPINIEVTQGTLGLFSEAGLKVKAGQELSAADLEGKFPPVIIACLKELALKTKLGKQSVFSQGQFLEAYSGWTRLWFGHLSGEAIEELSSRLGISLRTARERLNGQMPKELSCVAKRRGKDYGLPGAVSDNGRELTQALGVLWFRGKLVGRTPNFWEELGISRKALGINLPTLYEFCALVEEQDGKFFSSLESGERYLITKKVFDLYASVKDEGISLFRNGDQGLRALRQIQEYLASYPVYTSIFSQRDKQNPREKEMFRLFVPQSQLESFGRWSRGEKRSGGLSVWGRTYLSRFYIYNNGLSDETFRSDLRALRERRKDGDNVPSEASLRRWRQGYLGTSGRFSCLFEVYGLDRINDKRQRILHAGRLCLRCGEEVVHRLKERFPSESLPKLTKAFLVIDRLLYPMLGDFVSVDDWCEAIGPAMEQWRGLLAFDDKSLRELLGLKLVNREFPEGDKDETWLQSLPEDPPVDWSDVIEMDGRSLYRREAAATPLLDARGEESLARLIEKGEMALAILERAAGRLNEPVSQRLGLVVELGQRAKTHLVRANLRLVEGVAGKYVNRGTPFLDLVQEGNLGLIKAVKKFDWRKGYKFSTYATWWIHQSITQLLKRQTGSAMEVPVRFGENAARMMRTEESLEQKLGRCPTVEEVAEELALEWGVSAQKALKRVARLRLLAKGSLSLEEPVGEGETRTLGDYLEDSTAEDPEKRMGQLELEETIKSVLRTLAPREAHILSLRFGLVDGVEYTRRELEERFGLTRERIRQIEAKALRRLRHPRRSRPLKKYL